MQEAMAMYVGQFELLAVGWFFVYNSDSGAGEAFTTVHWSGEIHS